MPRLRTADCSRPGITRRRRGRGFQYVDCDGSPVTNPEELERIRSLAIPPAWTDVWICPHTNGHLQAVGTDAAGRRQYLYHAQWREHRDREKYEKMLEFARALPALRRTCDKYLDEDGLTRERVLAAAVRLLDRGFFRIGSEQYAAANETFGLSTVRREHVRLEHPMIVFEYTAKSGKDRLEGVVDEQVYQVVKELCERAADMPELLAYQCPDGSWSDVKSSEINAFIKELSGSEFTAKDFRTWSGTVLAAVFLGVAGSGLTSVSSRKRAISAAVREVSHYLGNTPAVCRASYIDPRVFDRFRAGYTIGAALKSVATSGDLTDPKVQQKIEAAVLDLLEERTESRRLEKVA